MKKATGILIIGIIALLICIGVAEAAVPKLITVQGRLRNATTYEPLEGTYSLNLSIWNETSGGAALYSETHSVTTDQFGIFQVLMGSITTLDLPFDEQYYLELELDSSTLSPRHSMTSSAYTYRANVSSDVDCVDCVDFEEYNCVIYNQAVAVPVCCSAVNISGICDDFDGCTIRIRFSPSTIVSPVSDFSAWAYYIQLGANGWDAMGLRGNTNTVYNRSGVNGDATSTLIIQEPKGKCQVYDDTAFGEQDIDQFSVVPGKTGFGGHGCYYWFCD